jgi:hypothetical protein
MELGNRLPSDQVLMALAECLSVDPHRLVLYAYCDRSPALALALRESDWAAGIARGPASPAAAADRPRLLPKLG